MRQFQRMYHKRPQWTQDQVVLRHVCLNEGNHQICETDQSNESSNERTLRTISSHFSLPLQIRIAFYYQSYLSHCAYIVPMTSTCKTAAGNAAAEGGWPAHTLLDLARRVTPIVLHPARNSTCVPTSLDTV